MEIGSFIELQFKKGLEYYKGNNVFRLNSGRSALVYAFKQLSCKRVYIPHYQCETVRNAFAKANIDIKYYNISSSFEPILENIETDSAIIIVNYYGIFSSSYIKKLISKFKNVIIDNSQAFFSQPVENCLNVYSARKFVGVPDGAYVIGDCSKESYDLLKKDYSSDTSLFLLSRIEYGCEGKTYQNRMLNEERIDNTGIRKMSELTHTILDSIDYTSVIDKRRENFKYASKLFDPVNEIELNNFYDEKCVPMVYPLVISDESVMDCLIKGKHFQGRWWYYVLDEVNEDSFEYYLSKYMIPITIDQRYGINELNYIYNLIKNR